MWILNYVMLSTMLGTWNLFMALIDIAEQGFEINWDSEILGILFLRCLDSGKLAENWCKMNVACDLLSHSAMI